MITVKYQDGECSCMD